MDSLHEFRIDTLNANISEYCEGLNALEKKIWSIVQQKQTQETEATQNHQNLKLIDNSYFNKFENLRVATESINHQKEIVKRLEVTVKEWYSCVADREAEDQKEHQQHIQNLLSLEEEIIKLQTLFSGAKHLYNHQSSADELQRLTKTVEVMINNGKRKEEKLGILQMQLQKLECLERESESRQKILTWILDCYTEEREILKKQYENITNEEIQVLKQIEEKKQIK